MHRTTTTATLLVTVAVSALSGCVTVQRPPVSGPPAGPARSSAPHPEGPAEPQIVQAPAREALELISPSPDADPRRSAARPSAPSAAEPAPEQAAPHHPEHPEHPQSRQPRHPRVEIPDVATAVPRNPDVCGLAKEYGGWHKDSAEARICEQTYRR